MATGKQIQNKQLIALTNGKKVGEVKDLYLDDRLNKIVALYLGAEGLINKKHFAMPRSHVQVMGVDAWLVTDSNAVPPESLPDYDRMVLMSEVRGREIVTEGGTKIGAVEDFIFDDAGELVGLTLNKIVIQGPLAERKVIARAAISTVGSNTSAMTTDLAKAEATQVPAQG